MTKIKGTATNTVTSPDLKTTNAVLPGANVLSTAPVKEMGGKGGKGDDRGLRLAALRDLKDINSSIIPDVRGWKVELRDGVVVGSVTRIILDQGDANMPRYLDVALDPKIFSGAKSASHELLIPIGLSHLAADRDAVVIPAATMESIASMPMLAPGAIEFAYEGTLLGAFGVKTKFEKPDAMYQHAAFSVKAFLVNRPITK
jgi:hypothetical protein